MKVRPWLLALIAIIGAKVADAESLKALADDFWKWRAKYAPFTADDVTWSYNTLARLSASTPAMLHIQDRVASVEAVEPLSYTVRFNLNEADAPFLVTLGRAQPDDLVLRR